MYVNAYKYHGNDGRCCCLCLPFRRPVAENSPDDGVLLTYSLGNVVDDDDNYLQSFFFFIGPTSRRFYRYVVYLSWCGYAQIVEY